MFAPQTRGNLQCMFRMELELAPNLIRLPGFEQIFFFIHNLILLCLVFADVIASQREISI